MLQSPTLLSSRSQAVHRPVAGDDIKKKGKGPYYEGGRMTCEETGILSLGPYCKT